MLIKIRVLLIWLVVGVLLAGWGAVYAKENPRIELIDGNFYLDGEKFLIKGIGYSPYRPGQWPGARVTPRILEWDFRRIKDAGFNTLRVWGMMSDEQLRVADKYGLKVIQAVPLKPDVDFGYSGYLLHAGSSVRQMCRRGKKHPNVIMYLLMNEPHADRVVLSGVDATLDLYKKLIAIGKEEDPDRPISMANAYWTLWLDQSAWDVVSFNTYNYWPSTSGDIGYANFVGGLKELHSEGRPFVVTEFGYSVSPDGGGGYTYGGNTEDEQAEGVIKNFRELIRGGAAGGCVFEWNDEWWKANDPNTHDGHAEEWFGIIGIEDRSDILGKPRKAYYALKEELKMVVTEPKEGQRVLDKVSIEVNAAQSVEDLRYRVGSGEWSRLSKTGEWWRGELDGSGLEVGLRKLTIKGVDGEQEIERHLNIIKCKDEKDLLPPVNIELTTDRPSYKNGDMLEIRARLTDRSGAPLKAYEVQLGLFNAINDFTRRWQGVTDDNGYFVKKVPVIGKFDEWYYVYWAGADVEDHGYKSKEGQIGYVKADYGEGLPVKEAVAQYADKIKIDGVVEEAWLKAEAIKLKFDINHVEGRIDSHEDLSAEAGVMWDEENIYLLVDIKDDVPAVNDHTKGDVWDGDCIEFFISLDPTKIPNVGYSEFDFQILIGANKNMWIPAQAKGGVRNSIPISSEVASKKGDKGYVLEAKINIANFSAKPFRKFKKGDILGFDMAIGDADRTGAREGKIIWNGTEVGYKDSSVWGRLTLK